MLAIRPRKYERLIITASESTSSSLESLDSDCNFDYKSNTIPADPDQALIYLMLRGASMNISASQIFRAKFRKTLCAGFKSYIRDRLVSRERVRGRPLIPKILKTLKRYGVTLKFRLTAPLIIQIYQADKFSLLNRLMKNPQMVFRITVRTPGLLWKRDRASLVDFLGLSWDSSVFKPCRKSHILKGIDGRLFDQINEFNPQCIKLLRDRGLFS